ncbi:MAG: beta-propeller domain-containing protein [Clostridia bacterium]|nr:beta-propeller domain-containing protein [Clostridia bacterium]
MEYKGSAHVKGLVRNQYSMDERNGILRVVTTTNGNFLPNASLFCVDINTF